MAATKSTSRVSKRAAAEQVDPWETRLTQDDGWEAPRANLRDAVHGARGALAMVQQELWSAGTFESMDLDDFDRIESAIRAAGALLDVALAVNFAPSREEVVNG